MESGERDMAARGLTEMALYTGIIRFSVLKKHKNKVRKDKEI